MKKEMIFQFILENKQEKKNDGICEYLHFIQLKMQNKIIFTNVLIICWLNKTT